MKKVSNQKGFTIVELIISAGIFSTILLICTAGVLFVGRLFYKGITSSATQEVARSVMDRLSNDFELSGGYFVQLPPSGGSEGFCIGSHLYSYKLDQLITPAGAGHAFVVRDYPNCDTSPPGGPDNIVTGNSFAGAGVANQWRELLGPNMRIVTFTATPNQPTQPQALGISLNIISGDNTFTTGNRCNGTAGSQFCANSQLTTYVVRRLR